MEPLTTFLMVADFSLAALFVVLVHWLYRTGKISLAYLYAFWFGTLIGSTWEFTFLFLGPEFLHGAVEWPWGLDGWPRKVSHSIWDGAIFMFGVYLCHRWLDGELFQRFDSKELGIMWGWGIFQELLVEYLFNGRVWIYEPLSWNPVIIPTIPGSAPMSPGYTLIPQAVWVIAPVVFYVGFLWLVKRHSNSESIRKKEFLKVCNIVTKYREDMHALRNLVWGPVAKDGEAIDELLGAIALNQRGKGSRGQEAGSNTGTEATGDYLSGMECKSGDRVYQNIDFRLKGTVHNLKGAAKNREHNLEIQLLRLDENCDSTCIEQISREVPGIHCSLQASDPVVQHIKKRGNNWYGLPSIGKAGGASCSVLFEVNEDGFASGYDSELSSSRDAIYSQLDNGHPLMGNFLRRHLWSLILEKDEEWASTQTYPTLTNLLVQADIIDLDWRLPQGRYIRMIDNIDLPHGTTFDFILRKEDGHPNITSCPPQKLNRYLRNGMVFIHHHHDAIGRVAIAVMKIPPGCPHVSKFVLRKRAEAPQDVASGELANGNATITIAEEHGLSSGDWVVFDAYDHDEIAHLSGSYEVNSCPDSNTIEFSYGIRDNYVLNDIDDIRIRRLSADSQLNLRLFPDNVRDRYNDGVEGKKNWSFAQMGVQLVAYAVQKKKRFELEFWDSGDKHSTSTRDYRLLTTPSIRKLLLEAPMGKEMSPIIPPTPKFISKRDRLNDKDELLKWGYSRLCKYRLGLKPLAKKYGIAQNIGYGLALEMLTLLAFGIRGSRSKARGDDAYENDGSPSEIKSASGSKGDDIGTLHPSGNFQLGDDVTKIQRSRRLYYNRGYDFPDKGWFGQRPNLKVAFFAASQDNMAEFHTHLVEEYGYNPSRYKFQYQAEPFDSNIARKAWGLNHVLELTRVVELIEHSGWLGRIKLKRFTEVEPLDECQCQICLHGKLTWSTENRATRALQIEDNTGTRTDFSTIFPMPAPPLPESTKITREDDHIKVSTKTPHGLQQGQWVQIYQGGGRDNKQRWRDYYGKYQILEEGFEDTSFLLQPRVSLVNNDAQPGSRVRVLNDEVLRQ